MATVEACKPAGPAITLVQIIMLPCGNSSMWSVNGHCCCSCSHSDSSCPKGGRNSVHSRMISLCEIKLEQGNTEVMVQPWTGAHGQGHFCARDALLSTASSQLDGAATTWHIATACCRLMTQIAWPHTTWWRTWHRRRRDPLSCMKKRADKEKTTPVGSDSMRSQVQCLL